MLINSVNASNFGVIDASISFGAAEVVAYNNWLKSANKPQIYGVESRFSTCTIEAFIKGATRDTLEANISNMTAALRQCVVEFDSVTGSFEGYLTGRSTERVSATISKVAFELQGRRLSAATTANIGAVSLSAATPKSYTFNVPGNAETPCSVEFTLAAPVASFKIEINSNVYNFGALDMGSYVFDGENGAFLKGDANYIDKYDGYTLPYVTGGSNTIKFTSPVAVNMSSVAVRYKGRWQ